jgi:hypothetical protein
MAKDLFHTGTAEKTEATGRAHTQRAMIPLARFWKGRVL